MAICTRNPETLNKVGEELGIPEELRFTNYDDMISHEELDAIHIVTPIKEHYPQSIKALRAGKHTACTVPMATSLDELREIVKTSREVGKIYTMMETSLYTREYLYVKRLKENGELGKIQYLKGDHMQNMSLEGGETTGRDFRRFGMARMYCHRFWIWPVQQLRVCGVLEAEG